MQPTIIRLLRLGDDIFIYLRKEEKREMKQNILSVLMVLLPHSLCIIIIIIIIVHAPCNAINPLYLVKGIIEYCVM